MKELNAYLDPLEGRIKTTIENEFLRQRETTKNESARQRDISANNRNIEIALLVADHWKDRHSVIREYWKERNRLFIYILIGITIGLILSINVNGTDVVILALKSYFGKVTGSNPVEYPISSSLIRALVPLPLFYLIVNLYQRDIYLRRGYKYLETLEKEVRAKLNIEGGDIFTSEGRYYQKFRTLAQDFTAPIYQLMLLMLLGLFFSYRLVGDIVLVRCFPDIPYIVVLASGLIALGATTFFWGAYVCADNAIAHPKKRLNGNQVSCRESTENSKEFGFANKSRALIFIKPTDNEPRCMCKSLSYMILVVSLLCLLIYPGLYAEQSEVCGNADLAFPQPSAHAG